MDDMMWMRMSGGLLGSGIDWVAVFAFFVIAVVYAIVPAIGYRVERRGMIAASLYVLIGYAGLSLLQTGILFLQMLDRGSRSGRPEEMVGLHIYFAFMIFKMLAFILSMILFAAGLQSLRFIRRAGPRDDRNPGEFTDDLRFPERG